MKIRTRFAPSPTGKLHIGNARTAVINWLFSKHYNGEFLLRIDDTDVERSTTAYEIGIYEDLKWLGIEWSETFKQSSRLDRYNIVKAQLINIGRLYPCYESAEELDIRRKIQLSAGKPPIYDRSALKLTPEQLTKYATEGRKPHYRFRLTEDVITWNDMIKGELKYDPSHISDPIVIREDGSMTYMICSTVDDVDYDITHVIRGEDHITNTAIQIQMFNALDAKHPQFGHTGLIKAKEEKMSKRVGGFEISSLRDEKHLESKAIFLFLASLGYSNNDISYEIDQLIKNFDIGSYSGSATTYCPEDLDRINHKLLSHMDLSNIKDKLDAIGCNGMTQEFWSTIRPNLQNIKEAKIWWDICYNFNPIHSIDEGDKVYLQDASTLLPEGEFHEKTWNEWTKILTTTTQRKGKALFMPLRLALTGLEHGPELSHMLPLIGKKEVLRRLKT